MLLISPRLAIQKGDYLGSGIPYWPVELAILASQLRLENLPFQVLDLFGSDPTRLTDQGDHYLQGVPIDELFNFDSQAKIAIIYAISYMSHGEVLSIVKFLKKVDFKVYILENSQAVTAYAINEVRNDFFESGTDGLILGEILPQWESFKKYFFSNGERPSNLMTSDRVAERRYSSAGKYPPPAWELFPIKNYWKLPYSHGPKSKSYLPVITSRGCPYPCNFCVVPSTNERKFRARSADEVVEELLYLRDKFNVRDFQIEDLNPTVKKDRWPEISEKLLKVNAGIRYYFVSGTKAETIPIQSVQTLAEGGCRYISISPESGSERVMKAIGKPFDYEHGLKLIQACKKNGIFTQACFLVGHPSETEEDFQLSKSYLKELLRHGLDEAAIFVVAPFAGSNLFKESIIPIEGQQLVSFSPKGRSDWKVVERRRSELIRMFFLEKLKRDLSLWKQGVRAIFLQPKTKMENLPKRFMYVSSLIAKTKLKQLIGQRQNSQSVIAKYQG